jgi:hypothetical protein
MIKRQKKEFDITTWTYKERKHTINKHIANPNMVLFEMGYHQPINPATWNNVLLSRVQKQLRQYLYNHLSANGYSTDNYILILEGSKQAKGQSTFIDIKVAFPCMNDMEVNKAFCETLTDKIYMMMNQMVKLV